MSRTVDLAALYVILRKLTTPFEKTDAYKLGLIDKDGARLKKAETKEEKQAMTLLDRLVFNLKRLLGKIPGGKTQTASFAAALLLLREDRLQTMVAAEEETAKRIREEMVEILRGSYGNLLKEEAPTNSAGTGAHVAGLGDNPPVGRRASVILRRRRKKRKKDQELEENRVLTKQDLDQVEKFADKLYASLGIDVEFTRHFLDRVNDARNKKQITSAELIRLFRQQYRKNGKRISKLSPSSQAVLSDMQTDINVPFVFQLQRDGTFDLVSKTVMRKKDFKTPDLKLVVR